LARAWRQPAGRNRHSALQHDFKPLVLFDRHGTKIGRLH
jgi:hypothetical protein